MGGSAGGAGPGLDHGWNLSPPEEWLRAGVNESGEEEKGKEAAGLDRVASHERAGESEAAAYHAGAGAAGPARTDSYDR
jgi:hypothetical protein